MTATTAVTRTHRPSYDIFILVITILSLGIMAAMLLPFDEQTLVVLSFYDNLICFIFLADFTYNITGSHPRSEYFIRQRGWLDLLGSIPSLGFLRITALLRLARLSRLARISRLLKGKGQKALISDVIHNRGRYALFLTILMAVLVMTISSVLVLQFEGRSPDANIVTGGDALWWALVTITTVGYGDFYPVTTLGRFTAAFVMFSGVGIIGALASILASVLVTSDAEDDAAVKALDEAQNGAVDVGAQTTRVASATSDAAPDATSDLAQTRTELAATRTELAETRRELAALRDLIVSQSPRSP
jgi:voltage-gated potassium channel